LRAWRNKVHGHCVLSFLKDWREGGNQKKHTRKKGGRGGEERDVYHLIFGFALPRSEKHAAGFQREGGDARRGYGGERRRRGGVRMPNGKHGEKHLQSCAKVLDLKGRSPAMHASESAPTVRNRSPPQVPD